MTDKTIWLDCRQAMEELRKTAQERDTLTDKVKELEAENKELRQRCTFDWRERADNLQQERDTLKGELAKAISDMADDCMRCEHQEQNKSLRDALGELKKNGFLECVVEPACKDCTVCRARKALDTQPKPDIVTKDKVQTIDDVCPDLDCPDFDRQKCCGRIKPGHRTDCPNPECHNGVVDVQDRYTDGSFARSYTEKPCPECQGDICLPGIVTGDMESLESMRERAVKEIVEDYSECGCQQDYCPECEDPQDWGPCGLCGPCATRKENGTW